MIGRLFSPVPGPLIMTALQAIAGVLAALFAAGLALFVIVGVVTSVESPGVGIAETWGTAVSVALIGMAFAKVTWDMTVTIDTENAPPVWTLTGKHDGFPAYELYVDDGTNTVFVYSHFPEPDARGGKLTFPMDVRGIDISGTLP